MTPAVVNMTCMLIYKIGSLLTGLLFAYFGFRLFLADKTGPAGDLSLKYDKYLINVKGGAPGLFFSLFGAIIVAITVAKGCLLYTSPSPRD